MYETYPKGALHQKTDTQQTIGTSQFVPKGKGGVPGHPSGKTSYPPTKASVTTSTAKHKAKMCSPYVKAGGMKQVSFTAPKNGRMQRATFGTESKLGTDGFVPMSKTDAKYGVGGK